MPGRETENANTDAESPRDCVGGPNAVSDKRTLPSLKGDWCFNALLIAFFAFSGYLAVWGARIPVAGGLGYDGQTYGWMAHDFEKALQTKSVSGFTLKRCLPSLVVGSCLSMLGIPRGPLEIVRGFAVLNLVLLIATVPVWHVICRDLKLTKRQTQIGLACLLVNYGHLRDCYFYPVLTDVPAFFFSMLSLAFWIRGQRLSLAVTTLMAMLTWPAAAFLNACYLLFPSHQELCALKNPHHARPSTERTGQILKWTVVFAYGGLVLWVACISRLQLPHRVGCATPVNNSLLPLSVSLLSFYLAWLARASGSLPRFTQLINTNGIWQLVAVLITHSISGAFLARYASADPDYSLTSTAWLRITQFSIEPVGLPAMFLLPHLVYWGPWHLALLTSLPAAFTAARPHAALYLGCGLYLAISLLSKSRQACYFVPPAVLTLCLALPRSWLSRVTGCEWAVLSWLASRFWLDFSLVGTAADWESRPAFPSQWYFMQHGPWMNDTGYLLSVVQLVAAVGLVGAVMITRCRRIATQRLEAEA